MENILIYGMIGLTLLVVIFAFWILTLSKKLKKLTTGKHAQSLEKIIHENNELIRKTREQQEQHQRDIEAIRENLAKAIQNVSVVRFDALGDAGGKQSFAIGLTDAHKNGVVISSMYTRGSMNVFAKEIQEGSSQHKLTEEEKKVIQ